MRAIRGGAISIIFQEPMTSLSALHTVGDQIGEAVELHGGGGFSDIHSWATRSTKRSAGPAASCRGPRSRR